MALRRIVRSDQFTDARRRLVLSMCALALVLNFLAPAQRGLPIGDRQLSGMVPNRLAQGIETMATVTLLVAIGLAVIEIVFNRRRVGRSTPILLAVALMSAAVAIGALRGILGESEIKHALSHGQFVVPYAVAIGLSIPSTADWQRLLSAMRIGLTVPSAYSLLVIVANGTDQPEWYSRIIPTGASFGGAACILWLAHARNTGRRRYLALSTLCAISVVISATRGWIAALIVGVIVYAVVGRGWRLRVSLQRGVIAGVLVCIGAAVVLQLGTIRSVARRGFGSTLRQRQARILLDEWQAEPFLGSGLGYENPALVRGDRPFEAARPYLVELSYPNLLAKLGLVGFVLLAAGVAIVLWHLRNSAKLTRPDSTMAALFASGVYLLATSVANPAFESVYFHFFLALTLLGSQTVRSNGSDYQAEAPQQPRHRSNDEVQVQSSIEFANIAMIDADDYDFDFGFDLDDAAAGPADRWSQ